jgi:hypothetical protein
LEAREERDHWTTSTLVAEMKSIRKASSISEYLEVGVIEGDTVGMKEGEQDGSVDGAATADELSDESKSKRKPYELGARQRTFAIFDHLQFKHVHDTRKEEVIRDAIRMIWEKNEIARQQQQSIHSR